MSNISHVHSIRFHLDVVLTIPLIHFIAFPSPQVVEVTIVCVVRDAKRNNNAHVHPASVNANPAHVDVSVANTVPSRNCAPACERNFDHDRLYRINSI